MHYLQRFLLIAFVTLCAVQAVAQQRILFLGNSITYDGRYIVDLETWFLLNRTNARYEFINAGLPSETVSGLSEAGHAGGKFPRPDLHERLARVLDAVKPTMVYVDYGMNDGIYQPLDSARFAAFRNGMNWLYAELKKAGIQDIAICTPPVHDDPSKGLNGYDLVLDAYSRWILSQRQEQQWDVVDIHFPMKAFLEKRRKKDPNFKLAEDGVHPGDLGHWFMTGCILTTPWSGVSDTTTSVFGEVGDTPKTRALRALVEKRQNMMRDAWLRRTKFIRPDMPEGLPFDEAERKAKEIDAEIAKLLERGA